MIRTRRRPRHCPQFAAVLLPFATLLTFSALLTFSTVALLAQDSAGQDPVLDRGSSAAQRPAASADAANEEGRPKAAGNRLARETSPYLLLHAHNPVDWYPWGPEAFEKAREEGKLIFLSIGYSSCYWCHVMERKVFSNDEIAAYMNQHFVNVKVDREERPDVDDIYMTALSVYFQLIGAPQGGGWPLSMFLTPEGKPVVGGTYFPPDDEDGRIGFPTVMRRMQGLWETETESLRTNADTITGYVRQVMQPRAQLTPVTLGRTAALASVKALKESFDPEYGGVDYTPDEAETSKFPVPAKLALLLYEADRHDDAEARRIVLSTLDHIAAGGIRDHLGGGFHRYSTDRFWLVPHFEKMLYDNAQLADLFVAAFQSTKNPEYRQVAEEIFTYVLRDMTSPQGAFYSAQDAETDAVEGKYYVWSAEELDRILGEGAPLFRRAYGAAAEAPFEHGYVLHLPQSLEELASSENLSVEELAPRLRTMRQQLLTARQQREAPLLDDKVLTSWNGLMIRALARGGAVFERPDLIEAAEKAARFVLDHMRDREGRLLRTHRAETAKLNAYLDDYAFFIDGLLALYQSGGDEQWRTASRQLCDQQIALFWDEARDGFFFTSHHHEELLARTKNAYDAVLPSGNSVSVRNLVELTRLTGDDAYRNKAERTLKLFVPKLDETPTGMTNLALALEEFLDKATAKTSAGSHPSDATYVSTVRHATHAGNAPGSIVQVQVFKPQQPPASAGRPSTEDTPPAGAPSPGGPDAEKKPQRVKFQAHLSVDKLPPGKTCDVIFLIDIQPGWHINTNPAQPDYLIPTQLTAKSKLGVKLTGIVYPKGKRLQIPGAEEPQHAYEQRVAIRGKLTVPPEAAGQADELVLSLKYQACNEQVCLPPETIQIAGKIPVARSLSEVKQINDKLFAPPKAPSRPGEENRASPPPNSPRKP